MAQFIWALVKKFSMRYLVLAILLLTNCVSSSAKDEKYVEVVVSDTILVAADQFVFQVMAMPQDYTEAVPAGSTPIDYTRREREMRQKQKKALDDIEAKLKKAGFNAAPLSIADMAAARGYGNYFLTYHLSSEDELKRFQSVVRNESSANVVLQSALSRSENQHQARLYNKLMEKARNNANAIASINGKKLGSVLMVSEAGTEDNRYNPYLPTLSSRRGGAMSEEDGMAVNTNYPIRGRILVRYEW
jgi:hypothetical protein